MGTMTRDWRGRRAKRNGFTLMELLTVIAVIIIIAGITLPAFNRMAQGNAQKQAVNMITAYAASARAMALSSKRPVAVVFYEDASGQAGSSRNQTRVAWAQQVAVDSANGTMTLDLVPNRAPEYLPVGIKVATLNEAAQYQATTDATSAQCRALLFDQNGQLVLRRGLLANTAGATATWGMTGTLGISSPAVLVYDGRSLQSDVSNGLAADAGAWLNKNADVVVINTHTGNVIRWK